MIITEKYLDRLADAAGFTVYVEDLTVGAVVSERVTMAGKAHVSAVPLVTSERALSLPKAQAVARGRAKRALLRDLLGEAMVEGKIEVTP